MNDSRSKLLDQLLGFLWRQWTSLGVPGNRVSAGGCLIDPEALVLITTELGRYDARLLDSSLDWLHANGRWVNLQRLKTLHGQWPSADPRVLGSFATVLAEQSTLRKWETLKEKWPQFADDDEELLSISRDGTAVPILGDPDPRFRRFGLLRSQWEPRGNCRFPPPDRVENLLFMLRSLFGVNARAEIMAWLLTHDSGHPAEISRAIGYFSKSIQTTLNEMEESGHIRSARDGREKRFWLQRGDWDFLMPWREPLVLPCWVNWPPVFYYSKRMLDLLKEPVGPSASENLRAIQQRGFLDEILPRLGLSGFLTAMSAHRGMKGSELTQAILRDVEKLGILLDGDFAEE
ncbi:MAG: hypothetical protein ABIS50_16990 [Luteolibacter sp.]|uniref:hypothetical protein n=1 Tax=Luteolibacter sp. TaxID=1962973 RepID=UPI0032667488